MFDVNVLVPGGADEDPTDGLTQPPATDVVTACTRNRTPEDTMCGQNDTPRHSRPHIHSAHSPSPCAHSSNHTLPM